jgi:hypothetical protein
MSFFREVGVGIRSVVEASRVVSSFVSLWLWLYTLVTSLGVAIVLPPLLVASASIGKDPYLWSGRLVPWVEPLLFGMKEHGWLWVGSLIAAFVSWAFGLIVTAGIAGAIAWRRLQWHEGDTTQGEKVRGPFGSAGLRFFGTSFFYHVVIDLCTALVGVVSFIVFRYASPWIGLGVICLGLGWLGLLFFWRSLALAGRVRGLSFRRTLVIWQHPPRMLGVLAPLFLNAGILGGGLWFLLRYSLSGGVLLFLLQQAWLMAYLGHKLLLQATADVWAFPEPTQDAFASPGHSQLP